MLLAILKLASFSAPERFLQIHQLESEKEARQIPVAVDG